MAADQRCHLANLFLHSLADADGVAEPIDVRPVKGFTQAFEVPKGDKVSTNGDFEGYKVYDVNIPSILCIYADAIAKCCFQVQNLRPSSMVHSFWDSSGTMRSQTLTLWLYLDGPWLRVFLRKRSRAVSQSQTGTRMISLGTPFLWKICSPNWFCDVSRMICVQLF